MFIRYGYHLNNMKILTILLIVPAFLCEDDKIEAKKSALFGDSYWPSFFPFSTPSASAAKLELERTKQTAAANAAAALAEKEEAQKEAARAEAMRSTEAARQMQAARTFRRSSSYSYSGGMPSMSPF